VDGREKGQRNNNKTSAPSADMICGRPSSLQSVLGDDSKLGLMTGKA